MLVVEPLRSETIPPLVNTWGGVKVVQAFSIFWSFMKRFWCGLKQKSILKLEHHLFPDLNFDKNDRVVIKEVMTTALKYHHYSIIKIIKRPLKSSKDGWNTKILNIFNAWKQTIVAKTTFVVIFQIYVVMTTSCLFFCTIYLWHIKIYIFLVRKLKKGNIFDHFSHSSGHQIVVMSMKKVVKWILWFFIAL